MSLHHVSLFSGVGGIDLAMHNAGIPTIAACEIDDAARGVIADRFPGAHLYRDVKEVTGDGLRNLGARPGRTVLSAGFPCQDLSVAGRRRGMVEGSGTRSALYWEIDRLLAEFRPAWVVLENVPGLLSSRDGRDFGTVLASLGQRGYGFAYRVLDARHFGVPQRRRRVVIVGRLGDDGRAPAQVLLEPEGVRGDPAAGIAPRPRATRAVGGGAQGGRHVPALTTRSSVAQDDQQTGQLVVGILGDHSHALTAEGHDASEDGTRRGTPIVYQQHGTNVGPMGTLRKGDGGVTSGVPFVAFALRGRENGALPEVHEEEDDHNIVAFHLTQDPISGHVSPAMGAKSSGMGIAYAAEQATALDTAQGGPDDNTAHGGRLVATYQKVIRSGARDANGDLPPEVWAERDIAATLNLNDLGSESRAVEVAVHLDSPGVIVRRLTPTECERLQGFPDGHTATSNGRPQADSPRYKQMGNAVAVPVFEWVARRIAAVDAHAQKDAAA